jgi:hypothetical protein
MSTERDGSPRDAVRHCSASYLVRGDSRNGVAVPRSPRRLRAAYGAATRSRRSVGLPSVLGRHSARRPHATRVERRFSWPRGLKPVRRLSFGSVGLRRLKLAGDRSEPCRIWRHLRGRHCEDSGRPASARVLANALRGMSAIDPEAAESRLRVERSCLG